MTHKMAFSIAKGCLLLTLLFLECFLSQALPCAKLTESPGHVVCVCNGTYCDDFPSIQKVSKGQYAVYTSSENGLRFHMETFKSKATSSNAVYKINTTQRRQSIIGFGGAFTDAAGINIAALPVSVQDKLIGAYYGKEGIGYTVGRVPMASCDFSTHPYSYDDVPGDLNLTKFALAPEDLKYKIPFIHLAMNKSLHPIKMFASPWSAPAWMKTNNNMTGKGSLKGEPGGPYFKAWAKYFVRFLEEYSSHNISFWGLTVQNEPLDGRIAHFRFQCMGYTAEMERDFVKKDLGPALKSSVFKDINLMILDDQRLAVLDWANVILSDPEASKYVSGIAIHWYMDEFLPANLLEKTHDAFPNKFIFATEACEGSMPWQSHVILGSWDRAVTYAHDIITEWGSDTSTLLQIYRTLIRSKLDYASFIYGSARPSYLSRLDSIHHQGLHLALGAFRTSPVESLYAEADEPPLKIRRKKLALQYVAKIQSVENNPAHQHLQSNNTKDLNRWVTGWTDWNIALSPIGGPNWVSNFVDSPVIVDAKKARFYKQPMYYALGHFSKFFVPNSVWVSVTAEKENDHIETTAFQRPDRSVAVVINNFGYDSANITIQAEGIGYMDVFSPGRSIQTVVWWMD